MKKFTGEIDIEIKDLIISLNKIAGVSTWSSCQGGKEESGKEHASHTFIMFDKLPAKYWSRIKKSNKFKISKRGMAWTLTTYKPKKFRQKTKYDYIVESINSKNNHLFQSEIKRIFGIDK